MDNLYAFASEMESESGSLAGNQGILDDMRSSVLINNAWQDKKNSQREPSLADFKMIVVLGKGTFGKVFLAEFQMNKQLYAIKVIRKDILIEYN